MFGKLFNRYRKPVDPQVRAEREREQREATKARHQAEAEAAKQRGLIESGYDNWSPGGF
jgi:hypothetical protein